MPTCGDYNGHQGALKAVAVHPDLLHYAALLVGGLNLLSRNVLSCAQPQPGYLVTLKVA